MWHRSGLFALGSPPPAGIEMPKPRCVLPGSTYLVTRRCSQRQFLLTPCPRTNQLFRFCIATAAERFGIRLHAFVALSNHYHLVLTDPHAELPRFMHWVNEYLAKCMNATLGRWENFWAPGSYSAVRLIDRAGVVDKLVYVYANAVAAGLVPTPQAWPGARSLPRDLVAPARLVRRPNVFFRADGLVPDEVELRLDIPPALASDDPDAVAEELTRRLLERVVRIRRRVRRRGRGFIGVGRVLRTRPGDRPDSHEPRRNLGPAIAAGDRAARTGAIRALKEFLRRYREALATFGQGARDAVFPAGTYAMRIRFGVPCEPT